MVLAPAIMAAIGALGVNLVLHGWSEHHVVIGAVAVFVAAELAGNVPRLLFAGQQVIVEDLIKETLFFGALGALAGVMIFWVEAHIGGPVTPVIPALAAYYLSLRPANR